MNIDGQLIRHSRQERGWTQQQLAEVAALSLRTVQRVENQSLASHETLAALCSVLELDRNRLREPELRLEKANRQIWLALVAFSLALMLGLFIGVLGTLTYLNP